MKRDEVLNLVWTHKLAHEERFGATNLVLFDSFDVDQSTVTRDVNVLVTFVSRVASKTCFGR